MALSFRFSKQQLQHVAVFAMLLNHVRHLVFPPGSVCGFVFENIGYFTAPVMCWFLVQGFHRTRSHKQYFLRLLFFAVLSQGVYSMYFGPPYRLNMLFTLCICFLILVVRSSGLDYGMKLFLQVLAVVCTSFCDWPYIAAIAVVLFDMAFRKGTRPFVRMAFLAVAFLSAVFLGLGCESVYFSPGLRFAAGFAGPAMAGVCIVRFLDAGKPAGCTPRLYFYWFYPVHLSVLLVLRCLAVH